ncbi:MAG: hypothetical protein GY954_00245 [Alteromonas sp.]|nr:hypothetical protein [Alteromonas sp.]
MMWNNFKSMPTLLKFFTAHALACVAFLFGSIIPHNSFSINGQPVTYSEWWSSGTGIYVSLLGTIMAVAGYLLLTKKQYSRQIYLFVLSLGLVVPYLKFGDNILAATGVFFVLLIAGYLFLRAPVREYFTSNKQRNSDSGASAPPPVR